MMSLFGTKFSATSSTHSDSSPRESPGRCPPGLMSCLSTNGSGGCGASGGGGAIIDLQKLLAGGASASPLCSDEESRSLAFQMALKCADLGHLTNAKAVHRK